MLIDRPFLYKLLTAFFQRLLQTDKRVPSDMKQGLQDFLGLHRNIGNLAKELHTAREGKEPHKDVVEIKRLRVVEESKGPQVNKYD